VARRWPLAGERAGRLAGAGAAILSQGLVAGASLALQLLALVHLGTAGLGVFAILTAGVVVTGTAVFTGWVGDPLVLLDRHEPALRRAILAAFAIATAAAVAVGGGAAIVVGGVDAPTGALFGVVLAAWFVEEAGRRLLMARQSFVALVVNDAAYGLVALGVALGVVAAGELTLRWLLVAMLAGSVAAAAVVIGQVPRGELALPGRGPVAWRRLAEVAGWRSGQLVLRPAGMLVARVVVAALTSTATLGVIEAGRLVVAPVITAANGIGGFTLPFFTERRDRLARRTVSALALACGLGAIAFVPVALVGLPVFERLAGVDGIGAGVVLGWCVFAAVYAANIPVVNALTALGWSRTVFWGRVVDTVVVVVGVAVVAAAGATALVPVVMGTAIAIGTAVPLVLLVRRGAVPVGSGWRVLTQGFAVRDLTAPRWRRLGPRGAAAIGIALIVATDYEWRRRPPGGALEGSLDVAVLIELAVYAVVAAYLVMFVCAPPRPRRTTAVQTALVAWVSFTAVSALWSVYPQLAAVRAAQLVVLATFAAVLAGRASRRHVHAFARAFLVLAALSVAIGLVWRSPATVQQQGRFNWMAVHAVLAGSILALAVTIGAHGWIHARRGALAGPPWRTRTWAVLTLVCGAGLLATQTRGALVAGVVGVAAVVWLASSPEERLAVGVLGGLAVVGTVVAFADELTAYVLRGENPETIGTLNSRLPLWELAGDLAAERPLGGWGLASTRGLFYDEIRLGGAHNAAVNVVVDTGFVGFALWGALIVTSLAAIGRLRRAGHPDAPLLWALSAVQLVNSLTTEGLGSGAGVSTVWLLVIAAWIGVAQRDLVAVAARAGTVGPGSWEERRRFSRRSQRPGRTRRPAQLIVPS
jgi:exopolysaccharide production protein ExoQ